MQQRSLRPRIADVAREAGVSKTAVSFAFNSPDRLAPETALRIREVADSLGYTPHPVARMLTQRPDDDHRAADPQALSVIFSNPFFGAFCEGVALAAEEQGYALHFISPLHGSLARALGRATVDGVVAIGLSDDHPEVEQIRRAGVPFVLVDSTAFPSTARSRSTTSVAPGPRPSTSSASAIAMSSSSASSRRHRRPLSIPTASRAAGCAAIATHSRRSASPSATNASSSVQPASTAASRRSSARGRTAFVRPPSWR